MKKESTIICIVLLINLINVLETSASIRPIIINNTPKEVISNNTEVNISWYIIDDNPKSFSIYKNGSILQDNIPLVSNLINFKFNDVPGYYNVSIIVYDFSGNSATTNIFITIKNIPGTSIVTASSTSSSTNNAYKGTPGFNYLILLLAIITLSVFTKVKKTKKKDR